MHATSVEAAGHSVSRQSAQTPMHEADPTAIDDAIGSTHSRKMLYCVALARYRTRPEQSAFGDECSREGVQQLGRQVEDIKS